MQMNIQSSHQIPGGTHHLPHRRRERGKITNLMKEEQARKNRPPPARRTMTAYAYVSYNHIDCIGQEMNNARVDCDEANVRGRLSESDYYVKLLLLLPTHSPSASGCLTNHQRRHLYL